MTLLGEGSGGLRPCHQLSHEGRRRSSNVSRDIFSKFLNQIKTVFVWKKIRFQYNLHSFLTVTEHWGIVLRQHHLMTHRGSEIGQKSVTYF
jgi:hypothetical protein